MDVIAALIALILFAVALIHFAWGSGLNWPAKTEQDLSNLVVGTSGAKKMPGKTLTVLVAIAIAMAASWPLMWQGLIWYPHAFPQTLVWLGMWVLAVIFLLRGVAGYFMHTSNPEQPFKRLNRVLYSPLCLLLGCGFLLLVTAPL